MKAENKQEDLLVEYLLHQADTNLILAQRNSEWCGHGPVLEQDIAITNISLDVLGQARNFYQYAASLLGNDKTEDSLAYLRTEREYRNLLLVELPKGDWAVTILRQFFYSVYQKLLFQELGKSRDEQLVAIAVKSLKEVDYHVRWSGEWVVRLGDGTEESRKRIEAAIEELWPYTGEMFMDSAFEKAMAEKKLAPLPSSVLQPWNEITASVFQEAGLTVPAPAFFHSGGKEGKHTEHLGYILSEMQYLQRVYPGAEW